MYWTHFLQQQRRSFTVNKVHHIQLRLHSPDNLDNRRTSLHYGSKCADLSWEGVRATNTVYIHVRDLLEYFCLVYNVHFTYLAPEDLYVTYNKMRNGWRQMKIRAEQVIESPQSLECGNLKCTPEKWTRVGNLAPVPPLTSLPSSPPSGFVHWPLMSASGDSGCTVSSRLRLSSLTTIIINYRLFWPRGRGRSIFFFKTDVV